MSVKRLVRFVSVQRIAALAKVSLTFMRISLLTFYCPVTTVAREHMPYVLCPVKV
jgi:hypothetical protein